MEELNENKILNSICDILEDDGISYDSRPDDNIITISDPDDLDAAIQDVESIVGDGYYVDEDVLEIYIDDFFGDQVDEGIIKDGIKKLDDFIHEEDPEFDLELEDELADKIIDIYRNVPNEEEARKQVFDILFADEELKDMLSDKYGREAIFRLLDKLQRKAKFRNFKNKIFKEEQLNEGSECWDYGDYLICCDDFRNNWWVEDSDCNLVASGFKSREEAIEYAKKKFSPTSGFKHTDEKSLNEDAIDDILEQLPDFDGDYETGMYFDSMTDANKAAKVLDKNNIEYELFRDDPEYAAVIVVGYYDDWMSQLNKSLNESQIEVEEEKNKVAEMTRDELIDKVAELSSDDEGLDDLTDDELAHILNTSGD